MKIDLKKTMATGLGIVIPFLSTKPTVVFNIKEHKIKRLKDQIVISRKVVINQDIPILKEYINIGTANLELDNIDQSITKEIITFGTAVNNVPIWKELPKLSSEISLAIYNNDEEDKISEMVEEDIQKAEQKLPW